MSRIFNSVKTRTMPVLLIVALIFSLVIVPPKKAEAIAPVVAGGAAAVLAADLGISVEALMAATVAVVGVGTGYALVRSGTTERGWTNLGNPYNPGIGQESDWWPEYQDGSHNIGDLPAWEDLTPEQQAEYGNPRTYTKAQWDWLWLQMGLTQDNGNGDYEPTPEPEDPEEKKKWQKGRNILTLLGLGAGTVTASEASQWLSDTVGQGLRGLLYGEEDEQSFDLVYESTASVDGINVVTRAQAVKTGEFPRPGYSNQDLTNAWVVMRIRTDLTGTKSGMCQAWVHGDTSPDVIESPIRLTKTNYQTLYYYKWYGWQTGNGNHGLLFGNANNQLSNLKYWEESGIGGGEASISWNGSYNTAINALYPGVYDFGNGVTFNNGQWVGTNLTSENYGQMTNTPLGLGQAINNGTSYPGFMQGVTNAPGEGWVNLVQVPEGLRNPNPESETLVGGLTDYSNYLSPLPAEEVVPVPDDEPVVNPNPGPNPGPNPDGTFEEDFTSEVGRILRQPFDQLFPFCLIGDLERLVNMIKETGQQSQTRDAQPVNGTQTFVIPLSGFGVEGLQDFEIELTILGQLGQYVRPMMTALFITGLLVGTFAFFLKRGGE